MDSQMNFQTRKRAQHFLTFLTLKTFVVHFASEVCINVITRQILKVCSICPENENF